MATTKPYLARLDGTPDGVNATLQWATYLGETFGANAALDCLHYYARIGWISARVRRTMTTYLQGLSVDELHNKRYDEPVTVDYPLEHISNTPFSAHAQSLEYIAQIADDDLEEHLMVAQLAERRIDRTRESADREFIGDGGWRWRGGDVPPTRRDERRRR